MPDDQLTAALDEIRGRGYRNGASGALCARLSDCADIDVPRLLAAVDAVLARHTPKTVTVRHLCGGHRRLVVPECPDCTTTEQVTCSGCDPVCPDDNAWPCADYQAITRALHGEDGNG